MGIVFLDHLENFYFCFRVFEVVAFIPGQFDCNFSFQFIVDSSNNLAKGTSVDIGNYLVPVSNLLTNFRNIIPLLISQLLRPIPSYTANSVDLIKKHNFSSFIRSQLVLVNEAGLLGTQNGTSVVT